MPGGLSRIAGEDRHVVSGQRGGSSKDTWVLSDVPVASFAPRFSHTPWCRWMTFTGGTVDPNTVHGTLDDLDVTSDAVRNRHGFSYAPRSPLQSGAHLVRVNGTDTNGQPFARGWDFWTP